MPATSRRSHSRHHPAYRQTRGSAIATLSMPLWELRKALTPDERLSRGGEVYERAETLYRDLGKGYIKTPLHASEMIIGLAVRGESREKCGQFGRLATAFGEHAYDIANCAAVPLNLVEENACEQKEGADVDVAQMAFQANECQATAAALLKEISDYKPHLERLEQLAMRTLARGHQS